MMLLADIRSSLCLLLWQHCNYTFCTIISDNSNFKLQLLEDDLLMFLQASFIFVLFILCIQRSNEHESCLTFEKNAKVCQAFLR